MKREEPGLIIEQVTASLDTGRVEVTPIWMPLYEKDRIEKAMCPDLDCGDGYVFLCL
jgi:hypothetical protein